MNYVLVHDMLHSQTHLSKAAQQFFFAEEIWFSAFSIFGSELLNLFTESSSIYEICHYVKFASFCLFGCALIVCPSPRVALPPSNYNAAIICFFVATTCLLAVILAAAAIRPGARALLGTQPCAT